MFYDTINFKTYFQIFKFTEEFIYFLAHCASVYFNFDQSELAHFTINITKPPVASCSISGPKGDSAALPKRLGSQ